MKSIVFDSGPIISLTLNSLLWTIKPLKKLYGGEFLLPHAVKRELIYHPLETKKYKLEALQVLKEVRDKTFTSVTNDYYHNLTLKLLTIANNIFKANGNYIQLVHFAEIAVLATAIKKQSDAVVIDERTTRQLIENPKKAHYILERKLHTKVAINNENLKKFRELTKNITVLRSIELASIAYENGILDCYLADMPKARKTLVESFGWALKLQGCSVARKEIEKLVRIET